MAVIRPTSLHIGTPPIAVLLQCSHSDACIYPAGSVHGEELEARRTGHHLIPPEEGLPRGQCVGGGGVGGRT